MNAKLIGLVLGELGLTVWALKNVQKLVNNEREIAYLKGKYDAYFDILNDTEKFEKEKRSEKEWGECLDSFEKLIEDIESQKAIKIRESLLKDIDEYAADLEEIYESEHREYAIPYKELIIKHTK